MFNPSSTQETGESWMTDVSCEQFKWHHHVHLRLATVSSRVLQAEELHATVSSDIVGPSQGGQPVTSSDQEVFHHEFRRTPPATQHHFSPFRGALAASVGEPDTLPRRRRFRPQHG